MSGVRADTDGIDPGGTVTPMASSSAPKPRKRRAPKRPLRGAAAAAADRGSLKPRRARENLDEADLQLIELLTGNGRLSNRALAAEIGLTEATVAARGRPSSAEISPKQAPGPMRLTSLPPIVTFASPSSTR